MWMNLHSCNAYVDKLDDMFIKALANTISRERNNLIEQLEEEKNKKANISWANIVKKSH